VTGQRPIFALLMRLGSTLIFAVMFALIKYGSERGLPVTEIMFWRQALTVPLILLWLTATGGLGRLRTQRIGSHALRALVGTTNMAITFTATTLLPLAVSTTLGFTTPLFAVMLSYFYLKEHVGKWRWLAVLLGFIGVLIICQPGNQAINWLGTSLMLLGGFITAIINYQLRDLGRTEEAIRTVFYFGLFGMLLTLPGEVLDQQPHDAESWAILLGLGITGALGQILLVTSLRHGAVVSVLVVDYATLIWATLLGWLVWDHLPNAATWFGAPLIVAAGVVIAFREHHLRKQANLAV
jgi:drug/metabolite transporter (DMT)-like permease